MITATMHIISILLYSLRILCVVGKYSTEYSYNNNKTLSGRSAVLCIMNTHADIHASQDNVET